ncbi:MAG: TetR/AcrR family transcriptional regulator [Clostridia bacterium]|nr:TetR/AcrR family transcriptional regulator [Clostridia bacterium]
MLKGDIRKQAILDTAETLFFEKGYVKATIQDFLDALDCSKGSFYHHFESKLQVLMELCREKTAKSFETYREKRYETPLEQLNALVYYAMPFREGEEQTVALLLPLVDLTDGKLVMDAMLDAQKEQFFPELCSLLNTLREQKTVYFTQELLPEILWDSYTAVYRRLMREAEAIRQGGGTGTAVRLIETERFLWERLLDAPFSSIELIRADEALRTISHAVFRVKQMDAGAAVK